MNISSVLGTAGMFIILIAYCLNLFKILHKANSLYLLLNIIGAGLLIQYSVSLNSILFIILNVAWVLFSAYDLITVYLKK